MSNKLSVCLYVMLVYLCAMVRAVDGIINSRSYAFYTTPFVYATIVKMLSTPIWAYVTYYIYIQHVFENLCIYIYIYIYIAFSRSHTNTIFYNNELI
jgi:hypothetical protein